MAADGTPGASVTPRPATEADGRAASPAAGISKADLARGRGRGAAPAAVETPVSFPDLRAFVVAGKKAEEEAAVLHFGSGHVSLVGDKGGRVFAAIRYADVTSASFAAPSTGAAESLTRIVPSRTPANAVRPARGVTRIVALAPPGPSRNTKRDAISNENVRRRLGASFHLTG